MEIGKLSNEKLQKIILNKIEAKRDEVILKPTIGEDCGALDFGEEYCVISTDPITGTENKIGVLAVNVALNDIAASGAVPIGIMVTMLIPPNATESDIDNIMDQLSKTASQANIDIIGGHTEITDAV
ncbi:MAG: AIR synthase, partial [Clostridiaceae bacterium]|nr:AIR synthase [Clostridiaceae bacterium]